MPDTHAPQLEPWQWSEAHWRKLVGQVRAGKSYRPKAWKGVQGRRSDKHLRIGRRTCTGSGRR